MATKKIEFIKLKRNLIILKKVKNIEIRPKGIILHINQGVYTYAWTIPYFRLSIYNGDFFTLHGNGNYIQFNKEKSWKENRKFLQKLIQLKSNYKPLL